MTVTVTATVGDVSGVDDNSWWVFSSALREGPGGKIITSHPVKARPEDGVLSVELEPGLTTVQFGASEYLVTIPETDADLWELLEEAVATPPTTSAQALLAAVEAYFDGHPVGSGGGIESVVEDTSPELGGNLDPGSFTVGAATAADLAKLHAAGTLSGNNTGDQDLSGKVSTTRTVNGHALSADVTVTKSDVGLGSADNTADSAKPISTATQTALDLKAPLASPTFTGTVGGVTKSHVGLGNVDNTADTAKPVSTAQQTALDLKAPIASPTFTGTVAGITKTMVGLGSADNTADTAKPVSTAQQTALDLKAPLASPTFTGTVAGVTKSHVGLGSVDNTADTAKPVSTAQQTALDLKAPLASPTFTGTVAGVTKSHVGLGSADNTADSAKSVASAAVLTTPRTINGVSFDGSASIEVFRAVSVSFSATPTFDLSTGDTFQMAAQTAAITSATFSNGVNGKSYTLMFLANGAYAIAFGTGSARLVGVTIPTTVSAKYLYVTGKWNAADGKFHVLGAVQEA